ncbi:hypothetical protein ACRAWF_41465 [Streptomyces sp. L7]
MIGRLILGHLPDPVTALRRLSRLVRPAGSSPSRTSTTTRYGSYPQPGWPAPFCRSSPKRSRSTEPPSEQERACTPCSRKRGLLRPGSRRQHRWAARRTPPSSRSSSRPTVRCPWPASCRQQGEGGGAEGR